MGLCYACVKALCTTIPSMSQPTPSMPFITCHPHEELLKKSVIFGLTYIMPTSHIKRQFEGICLRWLCQDNSRTILSQHHAFLILLAIFRAACLEPTGGGRKATSTNILTPLHNFGAPSSTLSSAFLFPVTGEVSSFAISCTSASKVAVSACGSYILHRM